ncbi:MAG: hypothetical protein WCV86_01160 [Patescibacteria group bacterium]|jgi:amidophosphoribosyltransferase
MCGIVGVQGHVEAARLAIRALRAVRNRGDDTRGAVVWNGIRTYPYIEGEGRLPLDHPEVVRKLEGFCCIAHGRYQTSGGNGNEDAQPTYADRPGRRLWIVENGDTPSLAELQEGVPYRRSSTEAEAILKHIVGTNEGSLPVRAIERFLETYDGACSAIIMDGKRLFAFRDRFGFRPLWVGEGIGEDAKVFYAVASESWALEKIGVHTMREIGPGEIVELSDRGALTVAGKPAVRLAQCGFELHYFAGVSSTIFGVSVEEFRFYLGERIGSMLALQGYATEMVVPVPDSSIPLAEGVAEGLGVPVVFGIRRMHTGRTFITSVGRRKRSAGEKYAVSRMRMRGKHATIVDDSKVRGLTMRELVAMLKRDGVPSGLSLVFGYPPVIGSCYYGIDLKSFDKLAARRYLKQGVHVDTAAMARDLGVNDVFYGTVAMQRAVLKKLGVNPRSFCEGCITGRYPTPAGQRMYDDLVAAERR